MFKEQIFKKRKTREDKMRQITGKKALIILLIIFLSPLSYAQKNPTQARVSIIPKPAKMEAKSGSFYLNPKTKIVVEAKLDEGLAVGEELASKLRQATGYPFELLKADGKKYRNSIALRTSDSLAKLGNEGYLLSVDKDLVKIEALAPAGLFYGVQSLYQLLPPQIEASRATAGISWSVPCVRIEDRPRFLWRGVHLDVSRHFFPKDSVKKYIDYLAMYKMNTFHWHLTEDQGWRIEIKKYPKLTEIGAWRRETMYDGIPHGGFYTQDEIREVVDYARKHFITVVPEIEMPGHSQAALASYPELSCSGGPFRVGIEWGVIYDVYCAGNEKTFEFLQDVLSEVIDLFPGEFVHIGGDEVPKLRWQNCVKCQARIKAEGLANENELQSYFVKRIERFLNAKGKRLLGWDEILEGGLAPNATVMSWRGIVGGIEAAKSGHDVVMTPTSHCYFDYYQGLFDEPKAIGGYLPIEKVYSYEPVPAELTAEEARHILGAQANIWTEYMPDFQQVEYMLLPRLLALSEAVWSKKELRNYQDFSRRIVPHYERLAAKEVNFRLPPPEGLGGRKVITGPTTVTVNPPFPQAEVHYTLDGTEPTRESPLLTQPQSINIAGSAILKARTILPSGRMSRVAKTGFSLIDPEQNGLEYAYYEGSWFRLPDLAALSPVKTGRVFDITLEPAGSRENNFALLFKGFVQIDKPGEYTFTVISDDGALIVIGNTEIVRNDGLYGIKEVRGKITLEAGKYPLKISYFQKSGERNLEILCEGPGVEKQNLPPHWFFIK
jgi:hexosaminidase